MDLACVRRYTRMLRFPLKREETLFIRFSRSARDVTLQTEPVTLKPLIFSLRTHSLSSSSFLQHVCTVAPSSANASQWQA